MPTPKRRIRPVTGTGLGVDFAGGPVIDPTVNVTALQEASSERQDALRQAQDILVSEKIRAAKEVVDIRASHNAEIANLRAEHLEKLRAMESDRLNAIRQVDVSAVRTEADRSLNAIQTLAGQTASNAETLRSTTASTVAGLSERIAALEKSSYEGVGKQRIADPMMTAMFAKMESIEKNSATTTGKSEGISMSWGILLGAIALLSGILSIGSMLVVLFKSFKP